jgi:hypothetical protein
MPEEMLAFAKTDSGYASLCEELWDLVRELEESETSASAGKISPVNDQFVEEWRDYERRFSKPVMSVVAYSMLGEVTPLDANATVNGVPLETDDIFALEMTESLEVAMNYLKQEAEVADGNDLDIALEAWKTLIVKSRLDVHGVLRRTARAPLLLVPQSVAHKISEDRLSLYQIWDAARQAFIFSPFACLVVLRTLLEKILRELYAAKGEMLNDLLVDFETKYRKMPQLHDVKTVGNAIAHGSQHIRATGNQFREQQQQKLLNQALVDQESSALKSLLLLRNLIEARPAKSFR